MTKLIGLDVGTSSLKGLAIDEHGAVIAAAEREYPFDTPRPGWDRIHPDYDAWISNLRAAGIRLLVVARANAVDGPFNQAEPEGFPIERVWADEHPEKFELAYPRYGDDFQMRIYRVLGK